MSAHVYTYTQFIYLKKEEKINYGLRSEEFIPLLTKLFPAPTGQFTNTYNAVVGDPEHSFSHQSSSTHEENISQAHIYM